MFVDRCFKGGAPQATFIGVHLLLARKIADRVQGTICRVGRAIGKRTSAITIYLAMGI
jgi:hypothetical protein